MGSSNSIGAAEGTVHESNNSTHEMSLCSSPEDVDKARKPNTSAADCSNPIETSTTEEFISQYGSHFSISSPTEDSDSESESTYMSCTRTDTMHSQSSSIVITPIPTQNSIDHESPFTLAASLCLGIQDCKCTQRIITALKWHSQCVVQENNRMLWIEKIKESGFDKRFLADYEHIMSTHLLDLSTIRSEINNAVTLLCDHMDSSQCFIYERFDELSRKDFSQYDVNETFYIHFMDLLHCHIFHSQYQT
eukprot:18621_1